MTDRGKVFSKLQRLRMADDLSRFLGALPVREVHESQLGDNIYMANGELNVGGAYYPVGIRVWFRSGRVVAEVKAPKAGIDVFTDPFDVFGTAEAVCVATTRRAS